MDDQEHTPAITKANGNVTLLAIRMIGIVKHFDWEIPKNGRSLFERDAMFLHVSERLCFIPSDGDLHMYIVHMQLSQSTGEKRLLTMIGMRCAPLYSSYRPRLC